MGGDEFMIFLNDITSEADVIPGIDMLCQRLKRSDEEKREVTCSMGVAFCPRDGEAFQELYQNADTALYDVKKPDGANTAYTAVTSGAEIRDQ